MQRRQQPERMETDVPLRQTARSRPQPKEAREDEWDRLRSLSILDALPLRRTDLLAEQVLFLFTASPTASPKSKG